MWRDAQWGALVGLLVSGAGCTGGPARITQAIDDSHTAFLLQEVDPLIQRFADLGRVDPAVQLPGLSLQLRMDPARQRDLDELLLAQQDPQSLQYHRWLTPEQFGQRFGISSDDLDRLTAWLEGHGFAIQRVSNGRLQIFFSGTAAQVEKAFATEVHRLSLEGEEHYAITRVPSVPVALQSVVLGIGGTSNFAPRSAGIAHRERGAPRNPDPTRPSSRYTNGNTHTMVPEDFATIYDVQSLYDQGITGAGVTIGVIGQTYYYPKDVTTFRSLSGLPASTVKNVLVPNSGSASTIVTADLDEAEADLEWSGAVARGAKQVFVYTGGTANGLNIYDALDYAIDNAVATILTISYNSCESYFSTSEFKSQRQIAQQANAQGITIVNCSGDSGAAGSYGCDYQVRVATHGPQVNFPTDFPEVTGVGGTEFDDASGSYWKTSNDAESGSVKSYIPETSWNDTTVELATSSGYLASSNGGVSTLIAKPSWQVGTGVPSGSFRFVPDLAFNASYEHVGYMFCQDQGCTNGWMDSSGEYCWFGGTSAAAPSFAGVLALVEQSLGATTGLGNINPKLYALAASAPSAFHDITSGTNVVPCTRGTPGCPTSAPYQFGYSATAGYDQVTGLGTIDVGRFFAAWVGASPDAGGTTAKSSGAKSSGGRASSTASTGGATTTGSTTTGTCGAQNFTVPCSGGGECPQNGYCSSGGCNCLTGFVALSCSGEVCQGTCSYPDYECAPRQPGACGAQNFDVQCAEADGGLFYCPTGSSCGANSTCTCSGGVPAVDCSGNPCNGGCSYPDWWCGGAANASSSTGTLSASAASASGPGSTGGANTMTTGRGTSAGAVGSSAGAGGVQGGSTGGGVVGGSTGASAAATGGFTNGFATSSSSSTTGGSSGGGCGCSSEGGPKGVWLWTWLVLLALPRKRRSYLAG